MKNKVMLYLFIDEYAWLREKAEADRTSMNRIVQDWIREHMDTSNVLVKQHQDTSKVIKTPKEAKKVVAEKFSGLCEHGALKGLCKKGC